MDKESSNSPVDWQCIHVTVWTAAGEDLGKKSTKINRKFLRSQKAAIFGRKKMTWNHLAQFIDWRHDVIQVSLVVARCRLVGLRRTNKGRQSSRHKNCFASKATEESLHALLAESQMPQNYYHLPVNRNLIYVWKQKTVKIHHLATTGFGDFFTADR